MLEHIKFWVAREIVGMAFAALVIIAAIVIILIRDSGSKRG